MLLKRVYSTTFKPVKPYNFYFTASLYAFSFEFDGAYAYTIFTINDNYSVVKLYSFDDEILAEVYANTSDSSIIDEALKRCEFVMGFREDLSDFYKMCVGDPLLNILSKDLKGLHIRGVSSIWEGLLIGISQQNASFRQGWRMLYKIRKIIGGAIRIPNSNHEFYPYPTPQKILEKREALKSCGVGYREKTFLNAAREFSKSDEPDITSIRGIGKYSATLAKILGKRDYSEFPADRWFAKLIPKVYGGEKEWKIRQVEEFAKRKWGKYAGLAAIMITATTAAKPIGELLKAIERGDFLDPLPDKPAPLTLWKYKLFDS